MRGALRGQGGEADDVAEEDGDAVEGLGLRNLTPFHLSQDLPRQKIRQKFLSFLLFLTVNFNPFVVHLGEPKMFTCCGVNPIKRAQFVCNFGNDKQCV